MKGAPPLAINMESPWYSIRSDRALEGKGGLLDPTSIGGIGGTCAVGFNLVFPSHCSFSVIGSPHSDPIAPLLLVSLDPFN